MLRSLGSKTGPKVINVLSSLPASTMVFLQRTSTLSCCSSQQSYTGSQFIHSSNGRSGSQFISRLILQFSDLVFTGQAPVYISEFLEINFTYSMFVRELFYWEVRMLPGCAGELHQVTVVDVNQWRKLVAWVPTDRTAPGNDWFLLQKLRCQFLNTGNGGPTLLCMSDWESRVWWVIAFTWNVWNLLRMNKGFRASGVMWRWQAARVRSRKLRVLRGPM